MTYQWRALKPALALSLIATGVAQTLASAQDDFALKAGDRVVFYGDSITEQQQYTNFVETYAVTRFPKRNITFVNSGVGGDRVGGGWAGNTDVRLNRDVFPYKPTVMTVMLGMNDGSYRPFDEGVFNTYSGGYRQLIDKVKAALPGVRLTLIQPSPYDDVTRNPGFPGGYNGVLVRYGDYVKGLAQERGAALANLNTPVVSVLANAKAQDADTAARIIPDRVHPGPGGHLIMAEALLKAWNAPATVTDVEIDAGAKRAARAENSSVRGVALKGDTLTWEQTDNGLPFPLDMKDAAFALAVRSSDFVEALNRQPLKVTGLTASRYTLRIDGETVGTFGREELAQGINLAVLPTPMVKQAAEVHALTRRHNELRFLRWRQIQIPFAGDSMPAVKNTLNSMEALEAEIVKRQRAMAQPKLRRYELKPE